MVSKKTRDPKTSKLHLKFWLAALAGLVLPLLVVRIWPDRSWAATAASTLEASQKAGSWQDPWVSLERTGFGAGWIRCSSLEEALHLDEAVDDGHLHSGHLILSEGGLTWRP